MSRAPGVQGGGVVVARARAEDGDHRCHGGNDGQIGEEHRAPPQVVQEEPGEDRTDGAAGTGEADPDRDRPGALLRWEHRDDQREGRRHQQRGTDPAHGSPCDDLARRTTETADERAGREHHEASEGGALATEAIADGAGREKEAGEHERVGVDDPLQLGRAGTEVLLDPRERGVEPRHRHDDHDEGEAQDGEEEPTPVVHLRPFVERHGDGRGLVRHGSDGATGGSDGTPGNVPGSPHVRLALLASPK